MERWFIKAARVDVEWPKLWSDLICPASSCRRGLKPLTASPSSACTCFCFCQSTTHSTSPVIVFKPLTVTRCHMTLRCFTQVQLWEETNTRSVFCEHEGVRRRRAREIAAVYFQNTKKKKCCVREGCLEKHSIFKDLYKVLWNFIEVIRTKSCSTSTPWIAKKKNRNILKILKCYY